MNVCSQHVPKIIKIGRCVLVKAIYSQSNLDIFRDTVYKLDHTTLKPCLHINLWETQMTSFIFTTANIQLLCLCNKLTHWTDFNQQPLHATAHKVLGQQWADHRKTYTGYESRKGSKLCVLVFKHQHSLASPQMSDQLQQVARIEPRQRLRSSSPVLVMSYQQLEGRHWVTEHFLLLLPGHGTVCHQQ